MAAIYAKVKHSEYLKLIERCETLEKENAKLKAELKKATAKVIAKTEVQPEKVEVKTETKKGGNNK